MTEFLEWVDNFTEATISYFFCNIKVTTKFFENNQRKYSEYGNDLFFVDIMMRDNCFRTPKSEYLDKYWKQKSKTG